MREERWRRYGPRSESDGLGSRLSGKRLQSGTTISSSLTTALVALPLMPLRVRMRTFSTFLSFLTGTVTAPRVELRMETRPPNSSESYVEGFCDLRGEEVVRERENRLGMKGTGRPKGGRKGKKGRKRVSQGYDYGTMNPTMRRFWRRPRSYFYILWTHQMANFYDTGTCESSVQTHSAQYHDTLQRHCVRALRYGKVWIR